MSYERLIIGAIVLVLRTAVVGIVIRLRAQYIPTVVAQTMMPMSFSDMASRVIRLEGWRGLLKGIVPMAMRDIALLLTTALIDSDIMPLVFNTMHPYVSIVYSVPLSIFIIRAVTTTADLSFLDFRGSMRVLLSPAERRNPWLLYLTPGLGFLVFIQVVRSEALIRTVLPAIDTYFPQANKTIVGTSTRYLAWLVMMLFHQASTSPLEVMKIRLALQRNISISEVESRDLEKKVENNMESSSIKLLHLRKDLDLPPYAGMSHCQQIMANEEGFLTLFPGRAWWFTVLTNLLAIYGGSNAAPFS